MFNNTTFTITGRLATKPAILKAKRVRDNRAAQSQPETESYLGESINNMNQTQA